MLIDEGDPTPTRSFEDAPVEGEAILDLAEDDLPEPDSPDLPAVPRPPLPVRPPVNGNAVQFYGEIRSAAAAQMYGLADLIKGVDATLLELSGHPDQLGLTELFLHIRAGLGSAYSAGGKVLYTLRPA